MTTFGPELLGTRLRHLIDVLDREIVAVYEALGVTGVRPRSVAYLRILSRVGSASIGDLAAAVGVTHSAASQAVAQLSRDGLVTLHRGSDARHRIARLTPAGTKLIPTLDAEWAATTAATEALEAELPYALSRLVAETLAALEHRPMRERIAAAAPDLFADGPPA